MIPTVYHQPGFPACVHLTVTFNAHAVMYDSVEDWVKNEEECGWFDWISPEERKLAIAANSVWTCQWYPDTPVGFCALAASSFERLMEAVNKT